MRVLMVASEATPFVKTGGLADVMGALPQALVRAGVEVALILPAYRKLFTPSPSRQVHHDLPVQVGSTRYLVDICQVDEQGVKVYFVVCPPLYDRDGLYGDSSHDFDDNHIRFALLAKAALALVRIAFRPDVIHCHDWQAGLLPPYLRHLFAGDPTFKQIKLIFTIHNLGYQGLFPESALAEIDLDRSLFQPDILEFFGKVNILKAGLFFSDAITTVSAGYAREILTPELGFGLDGFLRVRADKIFGIVNGVDYREWSPETDVHIACHYSAADLSGKVACKRALLEQLGLPTDDLATPVIGVTSRFVQQKGFDLVTQIADDLLRENVMLAVLGSGDPSTERFFGNLAETHPKKMGLYIGYDNALAHRIEAGADMFLMPSRYEPCGLNQIYSLRYGTVPIVRAVGGLDDTVDDSIGFKFLEYSGSALLSTIRRALTLFTDKDRWHLMMREGMRRDFSWDRSAVAYADLYNTLSLGK